MTQHRSHLTSVDPATGITAATFEAPDDADINSALDEAFAAQAKWAMTHLSERVQLLRSLARVLRDEKHRFAALITAEMGKPIAEAEAEIEKCALNCDFYAANAPAFLAEEVIESNAAHSGVVFEPLGVVLAVMPWNYPFWQLFRFLAPALAAGNGVVLKHASNVPRCALAIEEAVTLAGAPHGLFRTMLVPASRVSALIADSRIAAVTLTGSTEVGREVASDAGRALKRQVLELGGSDPFIVLADADVQEAARVATRARFQNVGQSCIAAKRFLVEESVADEFVAAFSAHVAALVVGDPNQPETQIGPMARANLRDELHDQVERTLAAGGELVLGGSAIEAPGYFYAPTVIDRVTETMSIFTEETFGPVAAIIRVASAAEAIEKANATEFGLGAALWTRDLDAARGYARQLQAGAVFINGMVASDPRLPFGGIKASGYGRELGVYGIREFTNIKTVWIGPSTDTKVELSE